MKLRDRFTLGSKEMTCTTLFLRKEPGDPVKRGKTAQRRRFALPTDQPHHHANAEVSHLRRARYRPQMNVVSMVLPIKQALSLGGIRG